MHADGGMTKKCFTVLDSEFRSDLSIVLFDDQQVVFSSGIGLRIALEKKNSENFMRKRDNSQYWNW